MANQSPQDPFYSPHEAMEAWAHGLMRTKTAMDLVGVDTLYDLYSACRSSDVDIDPTLTPQEQASVDELMAMDLEL